MYFIYWILHVASVLLILHSPPVTTTECTVDSPREYKWYVGDTMRWSCTLKETCSPRNSSYMYFYSKRTVLPDNLTRIVDEHTRELVIPNVTKEYQAPYWCYIKTESGYLKQIEMKVKTKLLEPDVTVVWKFFNAAADSLVVEASPAESNRGDDSDIWNTSTIKYRLIHRRLNRLNRTYKRLNEDCKAYGDANTACDPGREWPCDCPDLRVQGNGTVTCRLTRAGGDRCLMVDIDLTYEFHITMNRAGFDSIWKNHTVKVIDSDLSFAIPPFAKNISSVDHSRSANVRWNGWDGDEEVEHNVSYRSESPWDDHTWKGPISTYTNTVNLTHLRPATKYEVTIAAKFKEGSLLNSTVYSFSTLEDIPSSSPKLSVGSYSYLNGACPKTKCPHRNVLISIQPVSGEDRNGNLTNYSITTIQEMTGVNKTIIAPFNETNALIVTDLNVDESYRIEISARTAKGWSRVPSSIFIPAAVDRPPLPVKVIAIKMGKNTIQLIWEAPSSGYEYAEYNHTVHWCDVGTGESFFDDLPQCKRNYAWATVNGNVSVYNITVEQVDRLASYRYGVSVDVVNGGTLSSGISWSECLYDIEKGPGKVRGLDATPNETDQTVLGLSWSPANCKQQNSELLGLPSQYEIQYSLYKATSTLDQSKTGSWCNSAEHNLTVDAKSTTTRISGLDRDQKYGVCVRARSPGGYSSWDMKMAVIEAEVDDGFDRVGVAIAVSLVVFSLFALILGILVYRSWWSKRDKIEITDPPQFPWQADYYTAIPESYETMSEDGSITASNGIPNGAIARGVAHQVSSSGESNSSAGSTRPLVPNERQSRQRSYGVDSVQTQISSVASGESTADNQNEAITDIQPIIEDESIPTEWSAASSNSWDNNYTKRKHNDNDEIQHDSFDESGRCINLSSNPRCDHAQPNPSGALIPLVELNPSGSSLNPKVPPDGERVNPAVTADHAPADLALSAAQSESRSVEIGKPSKPPTRVGKVPNLRADSAAKPGTSSAGSLEYSRFAETPDSGSSSLPALSNNTEVKGEISRTEGHKKGNGVSHSKSRTSKKSGAEKVESDVMEDSVDL